MKICIILLGANRNPVGGYKIVYEYANRLSKEGHNINILFLNDTQFKRYHIPESLRKILVNIYTLIEPRWFKLDKKIKKISNQQKGYEKLVEGADICIATAVQTVDTVQNLFLSSKKLYLIQDYENWDISNERLEDTYSLGMQNIVISSWLKNIVDKKSKEPSVLIRNPIDIEVYKVYSTIEKRNKYKIGVLYHKSPQKGFKFAYEAILILKKRFPQLEVLMFGTPPKPLHLPKWIKYFKNASQKKTVAIYNSISLFLCASINEGYGLTGAESMACGAALVSTDYESVHEYAENGKNALLSPIRDADALANSATKLIENDALRIAIAYNGVKSISKHSWDNAMQLMNTLMHEQ